MSFFGQSYIILSLRPINSGKRIKSTFSNCNTTGEYPTSCYCVIHIRERYSHAIQFFAAVKIVGRVGPVCHGAQILMLKKSLLRNIFMLKLLKIDIKKITVGFLTEGRAGWMLVGFVK